MASLVLQLQQEALNKAGSTTDLLRLALVVARKLKVADFEVWIQGELNGYTKLADAPDYRVIRGTCEARNPYHGWQTVHFGDQQTSEAVTLRPITNPIGSLSELVSSATNNQGSLTMQMPVRAIEDQLPQRAESLRLRLDVRRRRPRHERGGGTSLRWLRGAAQVETAIDRDFGDEGNHC